VHPDLHGGFPAQAATLENIAGRFTPPGANPAQTPNEYQKNHNQWPGVGNVGSPDLDQLVAGQGGSYVQQAPPPGAGGGRRGGGPGGATCAAFSARSGLRTILLERSRFPRDKVCGDCLNPAAWPILDRLEVSAEVRRLAHAQLAAVDFVGCDDQVITYPLSGSAVPEIAVRRRDLDSVLLQRASDCGAEVRQETPVTAVRRSPCAAISTTSSVWCTCATW
jgi:hypothetical protein